MIGRVFSFQESGLVRTRNNGHKAVYGPSSTYVTAGFQRVELGSDLLREIRGTTLSRERVSVIALIDQFVLSKDL